jgi:hypothetical protein
VSVQVTILTEEEVCSGNPETPEMQCLLLSLGTVGSEAFYCFWKTRSGNASHVLRYRVERGQMAVPFVLLPCPGRRGALGCHFLAKNAHHLHQNKLTVKASSGQRTRHELLPVLLYGFWFPVMLPFMEHTTRVVLIGCSACRQFTRWSGLPCRVATGRRDGGCFAGWSHGAAANEWMLEQGDLKWMRTATKFLARSCVSQFSGRKSMCVWFPPAFANETKGGERMSQPDFTRLECLFPRFQSS